MVNYMSNRGSNYCTRPLTRFGTGQKMTMTPGRSARLCSACVRSWILVACVLLPATGTAQSSLANYRLGPGTATFGLTLPQGAVIGSVRVGTLETQTDVKTTWPDGSTKFAVVSCQVPAAGEYQIEPGGNSGEGFTPSLPPAMVQIVVDGSTYTSALPATLPDIWLSGPVVVEGRATTSFTPNPSGPAGQLRVIWDVRSYQSGGHRISVTVDNTKNVPEANVVVYSATISVAGQAVFNRSAIRKPGPNTLSQSGDDPMVSAGHGLLPGDWVRLTNGIQVGQIRRVHKVLDADRVVLNSRFGGNPIGLTWERITFLHPYMARWRKTFVVGPLTEASITPDFTPSYLAKALPSYLPTITSSSRSIADWRFDILGIGDLTYPLPMVGDRDEIGLFPAWVAQYVTFKSDALRAYVLRMGELAGTFSVHISEPDGEMLSLDDHPGFFTGAQGNGNSGPAGGGPETVGRGYYGEDGAAHLPSLSFVPYLLTGDRYFLDEMKFWANNAMLSWSWLRNGAEGLVTAQQQRAVGWALRDIAQSAAFTPDRDPWKEYFTSRLLANLRDLDARAATETDPLGSTMKLRIDEPGNVQVFMQSFLLWGLEYARDLGFDSNGNAYRTRIATYFNNLQNAQGFDWKASASYYIRVIDAGGNFFKSYADLYNFNFGGSAPLYSATPLIPSHYGVNLRIVLLTAVELGLPNAQANLDRLVAFRSSDGYSMIEELNSRQQYAVAPSVTGSSTSRPVPPSGVRIVY